MANSFAVLVSVVCRKSLRFASPASLRWCRTGLIIPWSQVRILVGPFFPRPFAQARPGFFCPRSLQAQSTNLVLEEDFELFVRELAAARPGAPRPFVVRGDFAAAVEVSIRQPPYFV